MTSPEKSPVGTFSKLKGAVTTFEIHGKNMIKFGSPTNKIVFPVPSSLK